MELIRNLEICIRAGEDEKAKSMIENLDLYQMIDRFGDTLLHHSAQHGNLFIVKCLLDGGSPVDAQNSLGWSPLMLAMRERHEPVVEILLTAGADILASNSNNQSALHFLFEKRVCGSHIVKIVLDQFKKEDFDSEYAARKLIDLGFPLDRIYLLNNIRIVEYMLQHGFQSDVSKPCSPEVVAGGQTLLHLAVASGDLKWVKMLLKYGADVHAVNSEGRSPVHYVYGRGRERDPNQLEILKTLLDAGVSRTEPSAFIMILVRGPREAISFLLNLNLDFNAHDKFNGMTVLHYLAANADPRILDELSIHADKFNVNVRDESGLTPLHNAARYCNVEMLKYLLERGAETNIARNVCELYTPLFSVYANSEPNLEYLGDQCIEILLQHNVDPQFELIKNDEKKITVFDIVMREMNNCKVNRLKPVVARLAMLEKLGTVITETTNAKINSQLSLKKYLKQCRQVLNKKVAGTASVFELLAANEKVMERYLSNRKLVMKLKGLGYKPKLMSCYSYYYSTLKKRLYKAHLYQILKDKAATVLTQLSGYRLDQTHIVVEKIIGYLRESDLRQLHDVVLEFSA